jgi:hypothetical protein
MRTMKVIAVSAVIVASTVAAAVAVAQTRSGSAAATPHDGTPMTMAMSMSHASAADLPALQLVRARLATAKYANDLDAAKADGYSILTQLMPGMGYHYINPSVKGFDVRKPPILVYEHRGNRWQLGALEWVFPEKPATPPLKGATYGSFPAACHYVDGTWVAEATQDACATKSPQSGAAFNFWHPQLVTMHVWIWYPNPDGLYASTNPLVNAFS